MYSLVLFIDGSDSREIEITDSLDLLKWRNVGYMMIEERFVKTGLVLPCAQVIDGKVYIFYQTYENGKDDAICHAVSNDRICNFRRNITNLVFRPDGTCNCGRAIRTVRRTEFDRSDGLGYPLYLHSRREGFEQNIKI
jgi:hypothetical protein